MLTGRKDYLPKLLEWVPRENLPDFFGGTDTSCDFVTEKGPWAEHWAVRAHPHITSSHRPAQPPERLVPLLAARQPGCLFGGSDV